MPSNRDNITFEKTSFLQGSNSPFIKELYLKYINNPKSIPESWAEFFNGLNEDQEVIKKEILGPSWTPRKHYGSKDSALEKSRSHIVLESSDNTPILQKKIFEIIKEKLKIK